jgi:hypothetical protein
VEQLLLPGLLLQLVPQFKFEEDRVITSNASSSISSSTAPCSSAHASSSRSHINHDSGGWVEQLTVPHYKPLLVSCGLMVDAGSGECQGCCELRSGAMWQIWGCKKGLSTFCCDS